MRPSKIDEDAVYRAIQFPITLRELGEMFGVTRQAMCHYLKYRKWSTIERLDVECARCDKKISITRARWKEGGKKYCSTDCYFAARANPGYRQHRHGARLARIEVRKHFALQDGHVVHHEDGNNDNNALKNLMVFASQSDHLKYHHGKTRVIPLWVGRDEVDRERPRMKFRKNRHIQTLSEPHP